MKVRHGALVLSALLALLVPAFAGDSGPKVGSTVRPFDVHDITGPNKGKALCYV